MRLHRERKAPFVFVFVFVLIAACGVVAPRPARAGGSAAAEQFFLDGRAAMKRGEYEKARAMFAESQRLDPAPGTLVNLALAEEKLGKLATAWEHARAAMEGLPEVDDRRVVAKTLRDALEERLARLTLRADKPLPDGTKITVDDVELSTASLGVALPEDPGEHRVVIRCPGHNDLAVTVKLAERAKETYTVELGTLRTETVTTVDDAHAGDPRSEVRTSPWRTVGFVAAGTGAAGIVAGTVLGLLAIGDKNVTNEHCTPGCDQTGLDAQASGRTFATTATVSFIAGAALAAGGVTLVLLNPKSDRRDKSDNESAREPAFAWLGASPSGVVLGGAF